MALESFLEGVRSELQADLGAGIPVVDGYVQGPLETELVCVYPGQTDEDSENTDIETLEILVRYYKPLLQQFTPETPADNSELIAARDAIVAALKDKQIVQFGVWFFRIQGFTFSARERWVEARLRAWEDNPYAL